MKAPAAWSGNPSGEVNEYAYDSATDAYDSSSRNYDGVVDADLNDTEKIAADWTDA